MFDLHKELTDGMIVTIRDDRDGTYCNCLYHPMTEGDTSNGIIIGDGICVNVSEFTSDLTTDNYTIMKIFSDCKCVDCECEVDCEDCNNAIVHFAREEKTKLTFTLPQVVEILHSMYDVDHIEIILGTFGGTSIE